METNDMGLAVNESFYNPNALTVYKRIVDGQATYPSIKTVDLEWQLEEKRRLEDKASKLQSQINEIIDNLTVDGWFNPNTETADVLEELCRIIGHNPVQTIEFSANITVTGSVDVELSEMEDFDLDSFLADALSVDSWHGNVVVEGFDVESTEQM